MSNIELNLGYIPSSKPEFKKLKNVKLSTSNEIWNIESIMSAIFGYSNDKDLIEFNTVCKRWNLLTEPTIHRRIKMLRIQWAKQRYSRENVDTEVEECIANNSKYSHYVKELKFCENIKPETAIKLLETFKYLTILHIGNVEISQDQFLCMVKPLDKLEELTFNQVVIKKISKNRLYKKSIQLPKTLTILSLIGLSLSGNTELFNNSINSHSNLKLFILEGSDESNFLTPFYECYASLKQLSYSSFNTENHQSLTKIIKSNPQLTSLKLGSCPLDSLMRPISKHLINLQDFEFFNPIYDDPDFVYRFSQPIKIKKLTVTSSLDSSVSWNSLLKHLPDLEEFNYCPLSGYMDRSLSLTVNRSTKIKKFRIHCKDLNELSLDSILLNCPHLKELDIVFADKWKGYFDKISQRCTSLEKLTLYSRYGLYKQEEYSSLKFLSKASFKNTLTSLTLNNLNFCCSANSSHLKDYPNLKFVKFQIANRGFSQKGSVVPFNNDLWPGYLRSCYLNTDYDGYRLTKIY